MTKKINQINCKLLTVERMPNSYYGNPRYRVCIETQERGIIYGVTMSDYQFAYNMPSAGDVVSCEWHYTRKGNVKFSHIEKA